MSDDKPNNKPVIFGRPFQPGVAQNPGGAPKELRAFRDLVRAHGLELLEHAIEIAKGDAVRDVFTARGEVMSETPTFRDRIAAQALLFAYGYGRPVQTMEMVNGNAEPERQTLDLSKLSDEELVLMQRLALKARREDK